MFSRVAHNFAKKGFYPTDNDTMQRIVNFIGVDAPGKMRIFDPCAGEGAALAELKHHLQGFGNEIESYGVEIDKVRAEIARERIDHVVKSDFMHCTVELNEFDLMLFNPPYGDLIGDHARMAAGEKRLEKLFFRRTVGHLRNGGLSVMILPYYVLDKQFAERIARAFDDLQIYKAVDPTYKQVVIFGKRVRNHNPKSNVVNAVINAKASFEELEVIPVQAEPYQLVPAKSYKETIKFQTIRLSKELIEEEMQAHDNMLWGDFTNIFKTSNTAVPAPLTEMKPWHSAMAIISGVVSGLVENESGERLLIKGACRKAIKKSQATNEHGSEDNPVIEHISRETEQYHAEIYAINLTAKSSDYGDVIRIR